MLVIAAPFLEQKLHPIKLINALKMGLKDALQVVEKMAVKIDVNDDAVMLNLLASTVGTKFSKRWADHLCRLSLQAVKTVAAIDQHGRMDVDIKLFVRVEKVLRRKQKQELSRILDSW